MNDRRLLLALALTGALTFPAMASAAPAPAPAPAVRIEIDTSALPKDDYEADTRRWVTDNQTAVLEEAGFIVSDDAPRSIRIVISRYGEYGVHTRARLMIVGDEASVRAFDCEMCADSKFLAMVDDETKVLADRLRERMSASDGAEPSPEPAATAPGSEPAPAGREPAQPVEEDPLVDQPDPRLGGAGYAGIASMVAGVGLTVGGVVMVTRPSSEGLRPGGDDQLEITDRVPLGAALTGIGASLMVAGAVLVAVDQTVLRRRRAGRSHASTWSPTVSPTSLGLSWASHF